MVRSSRIALLALLAVEHVVNTFAPAMLRRVRLGDIETIDSHDRVAIRQPQVTLVGIESACPFALSQFRHSIPQKLRMPNARCRKVIEGIESSGTRVSDTCLC